MIQKARRQATEAFAGRVVGGMLVGATVGVWGAPSWAIVGFGWLAVIAAPRLGTKP